MHGCLRMKVELNLAFSIRHNRDELNVKISSIYNQFGKLLK